MYEFIRDLHLYTIAPCLPLGFYLIVVSGKGGVLHRKTGSVYMVLIFFFVDRILVFKSLCRPHISESFWMDSLVKSSHHLDRSTQFNCSKKRKYFAPQTLHETAVLDRPYSGWFIYTHARTVSAWRVFQRVILEYFNQKILRFT